MQKKINDISWIAADWPAPEWIHAGTTTRIGGESSSPYDTFNLAQHVGDEKKNVILNRQQLRKQLHLLSEPCWLKQIHANKIINAQSNVLTETADGAYANKINTICVVLTADCLPLLLSDKQGTAIAAIHIGWRSFSKNIIENALDKFSVARHQLMAWLGPCISADHYEIDATVYNVTKKIFTGAEECFTETHRGHWLMDLKQLVNKQLIALQVGHIYTSPYCTYSDQTRFFSHRRDGTSGRMASLIWMDSQSSID